MKKKNFFTKNPVYNFFGPVLSLLLGFLFCLGIIFILWLLINGSLSGKLTIFVFNLIIPIAFGSAFIMSILYFILGIVGLFSKKNKAAKQWLFRGLVGMIVSFLLFFILSLALSIFSITPHQPQLPFNQ